MLKSILLSLLIVAGLPLPALATRVLIVDPGNTETGRRCMRIALAFPLAEVHCVQFAGINAALDRQWDAVVWLDPEPSLYEPIKPAWQKLLADKSVGLMFIGLPHDQAGKDALVAALKDRGGPSIGLHLSTHLQGCHWIWTPGKTKDQSHAYLRKHFDLKNLPVRAWIQITADNRARVFVNGKDAGGSDDGRRPESIDVTQLLRAGANVIAVDAYNEDGPAGVVLAIAGHS